MKRVLVILASLSLIAGSTFAQVHHGSEINPASLHGNHGDDDGNGPSNQAGAAAGSGNLINHGGPVMPFAHVVGIFWGSSLTSGSSYVTELRSFRTSFSGMVSHTSMLNQYGAQQSNLVGSQADVFDTTNPSSTRVTDTMVQSEVAKWFSGRYDTNAVYEVFIPNGYYSDDGSGATSCGGPNLQYCAYHSSGDGTHLPTNVKYSIEPYPSCSGCAASGFNTNQNAEHFMVHESRESFTDPYGTAWWDRVGYEADDKCAWQGLFLEAAADGHTYGYQPEYSNSARNCVR
jgi:hypothetical protein